MVERLARRRDGAHGLGHDAQKFVQVAIWDRDSGKLHITLDVPQGLVADNSGLAFSPDGRRFAFSAGHQAKLWDLDTGKQMRAWSFPEGMVPGKPIPLEVQLSPVIR